MKYKGNKIEKGTTMKYKGQEIEKIKIFDVATIDYEGETIAFDSVEQAKAFIDGENAKERFSLVWSPKWNEYWLYDKEKDACLDLPDEVREQLDKYNYEKSEEIMNDILSENPSWLYDEEYLHDSDDIEMSYYNPNFLYEEEGLYEY